MGDPIRSFKKTLTFGAAGVLDLVFDRTLSGTGIAPADFQTYLGANVDTYFTNILIDPGSSGINGAYCIESDVNDAITVDNTTFDDSVKRFTSSEVVSESVMIIRRARIYADKAGSIDLVMEFLS